MIPHTPFLLLLFLFLGFIEPLEYTLTSMNTTIEHPARRHDDVQSLSEKLRPAIEQSVAESDALGRLPDRLIEQMREVGAFRLFTPAKFGGWETSLTTASTLYESLGRIDLSTAWTVWNANFGFVAALLEPAAASRIWTEQGEPVLANSGVPGTLIPVEGGFRLSGTWPLVSGIDSATWFVPLAIVQNDVPPRVSATGQPDVRMVMVPREDYTILHTWNVSGMRGSGSNNVAVHDVFVPGEYAVALDGAPHCPGPTYRHGPVPLVFSGCTAVVLGAAAAAIDEFVALSRTKQHFGRALADEPRVHAAVARHEVALQAARELFFSVIRRIDQLAESNEPIPMDVRARWHGAMAFGAQSARQTLVTMYELSSSSSIYRDNRIERLHRDGMVALQHANHSQAFYDAVGRVRFGHEHGMPMF